MSKIILILVALVAMIGVISAEDTAEEIRAYVDKMLKDTADITAALEENENIQVDNVNVYDDEVDIGITVPQFGFTDIGKITLVWDTLKTVTQEYGRNFIVSIHTENDGKYNFDKYIIYANNRTTDLIAEKHI